MMSPDPQAKEATESRERDISYFQELRKKLARKLLDTSAKNPLIHTNLKASARNAATSRVRFVGTSLEEIFGALISEKTIGFDAIPKPKDLPADEDTLEFKAALESAMATDTDYRKAINSLKDDASEKEVEGLERQLRNQIRETLGMASIGALVSPTIDEVARRLDIDPSYDLVPFDWAKRERVRGIENLQVLKYPEELERSLRMIFGQAQLRENETGINFLSMALGYLEWYAAESSEKALLSPIVLCQVRMEKVVEHGSKVLKIRAEDEPSLNICLKAKLSAEMGLELPEFNPDGRLEEYLATIEVLVKEKPNWRVRRFSALGFYSFAKMVMHQDLLSPTWDQAPVLNPLIAEAFVLLNSNDGGFSVGQNVDSTQVRKLVPALPLPADASQISAIADALLGTSMVVQGPPGTGKSQTIANLIAAAIYHGKKVLFVAEKNAALHVVKDRLDKIGLGGQCLELHSAKTNKATIAKSLVEQYETRVPQRAPTNSSFQKLFTTIDALNYRAEGLNSTEEDDRSVYQRIGEVLRLQQTVAPIADVAQEVTFGEFETDGRKRLTQLIESIRSFAKDLLASGDLSENLWLKMLPRLRGEKRTEAADAFSSAADALGKIIEEMEGAAESLAGNWADLPYQEFVALVEVTSAIDMRVPSSRLVPILGDSNGMIRSREFVESAEEVRRLQNEILGTFGISADRIVEAQPNEIRAAAAKLISMGMGRKTLVNLDARRAEIKVAIKNIAVVEDVLAKLKVLVPEGTFDGSIADIRAVQRALRLARQFFDTDIDDTFKLEPLGDPNVARKIVAIAKNAELLRGDRDSLSKIYNFRHVPSVAEIDSLCLRLIEAGHFWFLTGDGRGQVKKLNAFRMTREWPGKPTVTLQLNQLAQHCLALAKFEDGNFVAGIVGESWAGMDTDFAPVTVASKWSTEVQDQLAGLPAGEKLAGALLRNGQGFRRSLSALLDEEKAVAFAEVTNLLEARTELGHRITSQLIMALEAEDLVLSTQQDTFRSIGLQNSTSFDEIENLADLIQSQRDCQQRMKKWLALCSHHGVEQFEATNSDNIKAFQRYVGAVMALPISEIRRRLLLTEKGPDLFQAFRTLAIRRADDISSLVNNLGEFGNAFWPLISSGKGSSLVEIGELIDGINLGALKLNSASRYHDVRADVEKRFGTNILGVFQNRRESWESIGDVVDYFWLREEVTRLLHSREVDTSEGSASKLVGELRLLDGLATEEMKNECKRRANGVPVPGGQNGTRVEDRTEMVQLRRQAALQRRHLEIRKLMEKSGSAIQALRPCFMMSPLSVSTYLPESGVTFDIAIMDEASQIKVEDALGTMLRASQAVIVGDPEQLPPTSFFWQGGTTSDDDEDDGGDQLDDVESILNYAWTSIRTRRQLNWHYRSKHHSLIAYSNKEFYRNSLNVPPAPFEKADGLGIKHVYVADHVYEDRKNLSEAKAVLSEVLDYIRDYPDRSLGVVAVNSQQSILLDDLLYEEEAKNPALKAYRDRWEEKGESLFVKNLENVQGDERDSIIVSTVYGNDSRGSFKQRFGPINNKNGHRRLNVLFTRGRFQTVVVTSIDEQKIVLSSTANRGPGVLKEYLEFARTGKIKSVQEGPSGKAPDSAFELFVMDMLAKRGFETVPQFGVAGFFIDIAVRDPQNPEKFICGVECDGAPYHSLRAARDRDKLREELLKGLGWNIYRIWSTDWFGSQVKEAERLLSYLDGLTKL